MHSQPLGVVDVACAEKNNAVASSYFDDMFLGNLKTD